MYLPRFCLPFLSRYSNYMEHKIWFRLHRTYKTGKYGSDYIEHIKLENIVQTT